MSLKKTIMLTAAYFGKELRDEVINMYYEDLISSGLNEQKIKEGYESWRKSSKNKFFPLPSQIIELIAPKMDLIASIDLGRDVSMRIVGAVSKFGYTGPIDAEKYIGKVGWDIVIRYGGWDYICKNLGVTLDVGIFQSNVREVARSQCEFRNITNYEQLESGESENKLLDFSFRTMD